MWKLLTDVIADQIYVHLDQEKLLPEEQKEFKSTNKNLAMAWIDYKKVYDMVPHLWIIECLDLFGVAENIKEFVSE